jgi:ribosomal protein S18 acetylase RimI-like enzyme
MLGASTLICDATEKDMPSIVAISDREFGKGYITAASFETHAGDSRIFRLIKNDRREVIGYCYGVIVSERELNEAYKITVLADHQAGTDRYGVVKTIVVSPEYRYNGYGTALFQDCLTLMSERQATAAVAIAWMARIATNLSGLLTRQKFRQTEVIKKYWYQDSLDLGFHCRECGAPPCRCSAAIYWRSF